jgi:hypothetical protein
MTGLRCSEKQQFVERVEPDSVRGIARWLGLLEIAGYSRCPKENGYTWCNDKNDLHVYSGAAYMVILT